MPAKNNYTSATAQDYYPFGMLMPGRNYNASAYKFGFNGKENDNEVMGITGAFQDYGMRQYNSLIARFVSVDPITKDYPELTPYQFASNRPIDGIDLDGMEHKRYDISVDKDWNVKFVTNNSHYLPSPTNADVKWGTLYVIHHPDEEIVRFEESSAPMVVFRSDYPLVIGGHIFEKSENIHWDGKDAFWERGLPTLLTTWAVVYSAGSFTAIGIRALWDPKLWGAKAIYSAGSQALVNKNVDLVDVFGDAALTPLFSNLIGGAFDIVVDPSDKNYITFRSVITNNKELRKMVNELILGTIIDKGGDKMYKQFKNNSRNKDELINSLEVHPAINLLKQKIIKEANAASKKNDETKNQDEIEE